MYQMQPPNVQQMHTISSARPSSIKRPYLRLLLPPPHLPSSPTLPPLATSQDFKNDVAVGSKVEQSNDKNVVDWPTNRLTTK